MAEKRYLVLKGQRYVGKHRTYTEGQDFPASELFGNAQNTALALEGLKEKKNDKGIVIVKEKLKKIEIMTAAKAAKK